MGAGALLYHKKKVQKSQEFTPVLPSLNGMTVCEEELLETIFLLLEAGIITSVLKDFEA